MKIACLFAVWNESRHGCKTTDGEGKNKVCIYTEGEAVGPIECCPLVYLGKGF